VPFLKHSVYNHGCHGQQIYGRSSYVALSNYYNVASCLSRLMYGSATAKCIFILVPKQLSNSIK